MPAYRGAPRPAQLVLLVLLLLPACGDAGPPLHERNAFDGEVELRGEEGGAFEGRLMFQRDSGNLQLTIDWQGVPVTLTRDAEGRVRAFEEAGWRDPTELEVERFRLVEGVVRPGAAHEPRDDGYAVRVEDRWIVVRMD